MESVPLFRSAALRPLFDYLARVDPQRELDALGRFAARLREPNALLPLALGGAVYAHAAAALDAPDLGVRVGEATSVEDIGELGVRLRSAPTVAAALRVAASLGS